MRIPHDLPRLRRGLLTLALSSVAAWSSGCQDCAQAARDIESTVDRHLESAERCCFLMEEPGRTQCFARMAEARLSVAGKLTAWQMACEDGNSKRMDEIVAALRDIQVTLQCPLPLPIKKVGSKVRNIDTKVGSLHAVDIELSPEADAGGMGPAGSHRLRGEICVTPDAISEQVHCASAVGRIGWVQGYEDNHRGRGGDYALTNFNVSMVIGDGRNISWKLLPFPDNRIKVAADGSGRLGALVRIDGPSELLGGMDIVWFEFPVKRTPAGFKISFEGLPGSQIAPEAPRAFADWNGDLVVDDLDYSDFLIDFADGITDLNHDGFVNDADLAMFEEIWESEL